MRDRFSTRIAVCRRGAFLCVWGVLPFCFHDCIFASLADATSSAPAVQVKRWLLGILLRARFAPRADKIPAMPPLGAFDLPACWARSGFCIGCDHAAETRKETPCQTARNPPRESSFTPYPQQSGGTKPRRAFSGPSLLNAATRMKPAIGSHLTTSIQASCCFFRRLPTWPTVRYSSSGPVIVTLSLQTKKPHNRRPGQGARLSALPFLLVTDLLGELTDETLQNSKDLAKTAPACAAAVSRTHRTISSGNDGRHDRHGRDQPMRHIRQGQKCSGRQAQTVGPTLRAAFDADEVSIEVADCYRELSSTPFKRVSRHKRDALVGYCDLSSYCPEKVNERSASVFVEFL